MAAKFEISEDKAREQHPLLIGLQVELDALHLALKAVSVAVGRTGNRLQTEGTPIGRAVSLRDEFRLDSRKPPTDGESAKSSSSSSAVWPPQSRKQPLLRCAAEGARAAHRAKLVDPSVTSNARDSWGRIAVRSRLAR